MTPTPTEAQEQRALFQWIAVWANKWPELRYAHHIPNGGSRNAVEAANLKAQGVLAGVPDICLPCARGGYHGLYIELKRRQGGRVSPEQKKMLMALQRLGYRAEVCHGWEEAAQIITEYMEGKV